MAMSTKIIAHRGNTNDFTENSIEAFESAIALGADGIEFDVHMGSDGCLPVYHDYYLNTKNAKKELIFEKDAKYLHSLNISFFPDVLKLFNNNFMEIELKTPKIEFIKLIAEVVGKNKNSENIEFTSPYPFVLQKLKESIPSASIGMFVNNKENWMDEELFDKLLIENGALGNVTYMHLNESTITKKRVDLLHNNGFLVHAANCNRKEVLQLAFSLGVDKLTTDKLQFALNERLKYERAGNSK